LKSRRETTIANDLNDKQIEGLLTFLQAERVARQIDEQARARTKAAAEGAPQSVPRRHRLAAMPIDQRERTLCGERTLVR